MIGNVQIEEEEKEKRKRKERGGPNPVDFITFMSDS